MQRNEAYRILNDLIFKGFIVTEMLNGEDRFVFKSMNEQEFDILRMLTGSSDDMRVIDFNTCYIAFSLVSINGQQILPDREMRMPDLKELFRSSYRDFNNRILKELGSLRDNVYDATEFLEGFCYTAVARRMWNIRKMVLPSSEMSTGIPGTSKLGLNVHQEMWMYINQAIDEEEDYNRQFSLALLVASASNPKGSQQVRSQHQTALKSMESRRESLARTGRSDVEEWSEKGWSVSVDTTEKLVAELERQMQGKKDRHDLFIEKHMQKTRERAEQRAREAEARIRRAREGIDDSVLITGETRALTPEENAELLSRRGKKVIQTLSESSVSQSDRDRYLKKIGHRVLTVR